MYDVYRLSKGVWLGSNRGFKMDEIRILKC